jgi:tetratricopeptide (TPR) repeat protein
MVKKTKKRQKQKLKKTQKQKERQKRIKKQVTFRLNVEDMVDYALEFVENGDWNGGKKILEKLKKKYGHHSHVYYGLGVLAAFDDKHDEAIQLFSKAAQIKPDFVEAYYNLGVAYQKQRKVPEMIEAYRQVVKIGETDSYAVNHAQDMLSRLEKQIQNSDGVNLDGYLNGYQVFEQGMKYMKSGNWDAAIAKFNDTIKITPNHPQSHGNLGICYASIGKIQLALESFDRAIELDPNYEPALLNRKIVESLQEGECLGKGVKTIEYYKDYPLENRSYIQEFLKEQGLLPEKT